MDDKKNFPFAIFNYSQNGIFVIDINNKIIFWNKSLENLSGLKQSEVIGKDAVELFPKLQKSYYKEGIKEVFTNGAPIIFSAQIHKYIVPCKLTETSFRTQHTTVIRIQGAVDDENYVAFSIQDVTDEYLQIQKIKEMRDKAIHEVEERKKIEEKLKSTVKQLEENQKLLQTKSQNLKVVNKKLIASQNILKELNDSKDKFFSIIGHDLKNPIQALIGYSEILIESYFDMSDAEKLEFVTSIKKVSKNVNNLLQGLLNWARLQTGRMDYEPAKFHIHGIVDAVLNLMFDSALAKKINLVNTVNEDITLFADNFMIETAIRNLVSNAIKFTHKGGEVKISACESDESVQISVSDTGVGMDDHTLENLFKIDKHISTRGTNEEEGTGLGLILCKEMVEKNNGKISVESEKGVGTTFKLLFRKKIISQFNLVENRKQVI
ncbi:MAG: PAS domain-containing sensor histidine kinase [Ignavibacteria bacterium]|jgi:PAS domain S-box-containing protein